jgi:hypothetical protein
MNRTNQITGYLLAAFLLLVPCRLAGQDSIPATAKGNLYARSRVVDEHTVKLRWAPSNAKAWTDGKKYGYTVERYTMTVDKAFMDSPVKRVVDESFIPLPLVEWEQAIRTSDYAAVIAQAFYGEDFSLTSASGDMGSIINRANELEQRFATSIFMAEYDYKAAGMAGWAWTDTLAKPNEKYLYRIFLNRPDKEEGDTAAVFTGFDEIRPLPAPIGLAAVFGDKSVMLSWNYALLASTYHSYHVERMAEGETAFRRITELPVSTLTEGMREIIYTDSLPDNEKEYLYRIYGLTGFDETGPLSDTIRGRGKELASCIPYIINGAFTGKDTAAVYWEFDCPRTELVEKLQILHSQDPENDFSLLLDNIPVQAREKSFILKGELNYIKLVAVNKDSTRRESFPFLLRQTDSIPPAVPAGLKVTVDTLCVAHLEWDANNEPDLRGYRILRGFTETEEKSSLLPGFIPVNEYTDTLSPDLANAHVYYALTAVDMRYNESQSSETVFAAKPNRITPDEPVFTGYEMEGSRIKLGWLINPGQADVKYALMRQASGQEEGVVIFTGDYTCNTYTDEPEKSGAYAYWVVATAANGKQSKSPQPLALDVYVEEDLTAVSGFSSYADRKHNYVELFWRKHEKAKKYRIYKAQEDAPMSLWKETEATINRITDEYVSPDTKYAYTILFVSPEGRVSKSKTIVVHY